MKSAALALFGFSILAQPTEGVPGQPADILADLTQRSRASLEKIQHSATRAQAEQAVEPLRAQLKHAIGLHRVSQSVRISLFPPAPSQLPIPALLLLVPECASKAGAFAQRGFLTACTEDTGLPNTPDLLAGITPQGRAQNAVARTLRFLLEQPGVDRSRVVLVGEGPAATLASALFPEFTRIALTNPGVGDSLVYGITKLADTRDIVALAAPRPLLLNGASPPLGDVTLDHYRLFEAGSQVFLDLDPIQWLASDVRQTESSAPQTIELPAEPATPDARNTLEQIQGDRLPEGRITYRLNNFRRQERFWETQPGIRIPVIFYQPGNGFPGRGVLYAISDDGGASLENDEVVQEAIRKDWIVATIDPRGVGAMKRKADDSLSFQLGEYFVWRQASDVARVIGRFGMYHNGHRSALYSKGPNATLISALVAATAPGNMPEWIALRDPLTSLESLEGSMVPFYPAFTMDSLLKSARVPVVLITNPAEFAQQEWLIK